MPASTRVAVIALTILGIVACGSERSHPAPVGASIPQVGSVVVGLAPDLPADRRDRLTRLGAPIHLGADPRERSVAALGRIRFAIGARSTEVDVRLEGAPPSVCARFRLTFGALGYNAPRLLFLKVKDDNDVSICAFTAP